MNWLKNILRIPEPTHAEVLASAPKAGTEGYRLGVRNPYRIHSWSRI